MSTLRRAMARLASIFRHDRLDRDFDEEATSHIALAVEDYLRRGVSPDEAERLARVRFGAIASSRDVHRDARGLPWLEGFVSDLRLSLRGLRRDRGFTLTTLAMLAVALGLSTAVFTIVQAMLFRASPLVVKGDRLAYMQVRRVNGPWGVAYSDFDAWRSEAQSFEGLAYTRNTPVVFRDGIGPASDLLVASLTTNTFALLGVHPLIGRDFVPRDEDPSAPPVVILNYAFWQSRFHGRPDAVGAIVTMDGVATAIVGVMPSGFDLAFHRDAWRPLRRLSQKEGISPDGWVFGRLRDGARLETARVEIETINHQLAISDPTTDRRTTPLVLTYSQAHVGPDAQRIYGSLWAGAWLVLLIACANVANLTLARSVGRWKEYSTRLALGATRMRMLRQLFVENLLLASVAAVFGWLMARRSVQLWIDATLSPYLRLDYTMGIDVVAYLVATTMGVALLVSLMPAIRLAQLGRCGGLAGNARSITLDRGGQRLATLLVGIQMALALVLLSGAGVLVRSLVNIVNAENGIRQPDAVLVGAIQLPPERYESPATRHRYFEQLDNRLANLPGVEAVSLSNTLLVAGTGVIRQVEIEGQLRRTGDAPAVQYLTAGPRYFDVVGIAAIAGRVFGDGDLATTLPVTLVNERFVQEYWQGKSPVGSRIRALGANGAGEWRTVVGVVPNVMQGDPIRQVFKPIVYIPFSQEPVVRGWTHAGNGMRGANLLLRASVPLDRLAPLIRAEVQALDPEATLEEMSTLRASLTFNRDIMDLAHAELGKHAGIAPVFGMTALLLAALGLYAVIAKSVHQRTKEIGVRMAVGGAARDIRRLVIREGMRPVTLGMVVGIAASLLLNRVLQSQLVAISPYDPLTLTIAPLVLVSVALVACLIPARRATNVNPTVALRHD